MTFVTIAFPVIHPPPPTRCDKSHFLEDFPRLISYVFSSINEYLQYFKWQGCYVTAKIRNSYKRLFSVKQAATEHGSSDLPLLCFFLSSLSWALSSVLSLFSPLLHSLLSSPPRWALSWALFWALSWTLSWGISWALSWALLRLPL